MSKKLTLLPVFGGALFWGLVIPAAQQQHPEWFANPWVLRVSFLVVMLCCTPLLIQIIIKFYALVWDSLGQYRLMSWSVVLLAGASLGMALIGGGYFLFLNAQANLGTGNSPPVDSPLRSDLKDLFFGKDSLHFGYVNESKDSAYQPKYWFVMIDLSRPYYPPGSKTPNSIPIMTVVQPNDFVRPGDVQGNIEVLNTPMANSHVKPGDKLWAAAWITCANCSKTRAYYIYFEVGRGGWYAEAPDSKKMEFPKPLDKAVGDAEIAKYVDKLVPKESRIVIPERLS